MRFITEMDSQSRNWLVLDTVNGNKPVGIHFSATLAALDAFKREQDEAPDAPLTNDDGVHH